MVSLGPARVQPGGRMELFRLNPGVDPRNLPSSASMRQPQIALLLVSLLGPSALFAGDGSIHNDAVWRDADGKEIWSNGGHIIREGGAFYWVGYDTGPGRPAGPAALEGHGQVRAHLRGRQPAPVAAA